MLKKFRKASQNMQHHSLCHLYDEFKTHFRGDKITDIGIIFDSLDYAKKNEPKPDLQDMVCKKKPKENSERIIRTE